MGRTGLSVENRNSRVLFLVDDNEGIIYLSSETRNGMVTQIQMTTSEAKVLGIALLMHAAGGELFLDRRDRPKGLK